MASETVMQWITRDMKLSRPVTSFESDFSNGYLFAEILQRFELVGDLTNFSKKVNKESKVKNFQQVESILRELKVKFDGKLIHQIMNEERGAALRLLYQMKLGIERADIGGVDASKKTMTNLKPDIVKQRMIEADNLKHTLATEPLNRFATVNRAKKLAPIERQMLPFEYKKSLLDQKAFEDQKKEDELVMSLYQQARQEEFRKMDENKEFMQDWLKEGKKNWTINQKKRAEAIARVKYFEDREVKAYKDKLGKELDEATVELIGGVQEFERNLQKLGIEKNTNIEEAIKKMEEKKGIPPGQIQNFSYAATMNKIKEKKSMLDFAVKERDRRRRKMIVDQSRTQSDLDKKKGEELLIQKLLKQQADEQRLAFLDTRQVRCKELVVEARRTKALVQEEQRKFQIEEIERKRMETMPQQVKKHISDIKERKVDFQALRREEKSKKRGLNIEICSEVIDLILDIANEAYDEQHKSSSGKLDKPMWREWMRYFKDNKVVSRARRGLLNGPESDNPFLVMSTQKSTFQEEVDILEDYKKPISEVVEAVKNEQCYTDFLEYISTTGIFNLTDGRFEDWFDFANYTQSLGNVDHLLNLRAPPTNPEIGRILNKILSKQHSKTVMEQESPSKIGASLTLKLCLLGRACSGKRTIAKQLQDLYPKLKTFRMDDMIREVIEYISPKVAADAGAAANAPKGKAPPPKGGKVEEAAPVDIFAGMDTKEYKEIGALIKKQVCPGEGSEVPQGQDLAALVNDDKLLVKLFVQKLRLTFPAEKSEEAKIEEIKQGLHKEKELLEQLAELEAANAAGGDPKAAPKGKAPPPKGGKGGAGGPSGEEQIRAELDAIQKVQVEGWLLIDFPRTLSQAKAMEQIMAGYSTILDEDSNIKPQQEFEMWSKVVNPVKTIGRGQDVFYNGQPFVHQSATDGYLFLDVPPEECMRRITGRKIDPTTGIIYHHEDNPAPEGDPKLKDRLQDYQGEPDTESSRLSHHHSLFASNADQLKKWASTFALIDESAPAMHGVNSLLEVSLTHGEKLKKEDMLERIQKQVGKVIAFKQALFDQKRHKTRAQVEAPPINEPEVEALEQRPEGEDLGEEQERVKSRNDLLDAGQLVSASKRSGLTKGSGADIMSGTLRSTASFKQAQPLNSAQLVQLYRQFEADYYRECLQVFKAVRLQRGHVFDGLTQMQNSFIDTYLARVDTRQTSLIQDFIDSYNKFSEEFPNLRSDPLTQEELKKRVTRLGNDMWTLVEQKKDQALAQHTKLNSDGWVVSEIKKLMKNTTRLIQLELSRVFALQSLVTGVVNQLEIELDRTLDNLSDNGLKTIDENERSPLFDEIIAYAIRIIQGRQEAFETALDFEQRRLLEPEVESCLYRVNLLRTWVLLKVKEFNQFWRQLSEVLDEGIITAVQVENEATQSVVASIAEHMAEQQSSGYFRPMDYSDFRIPFLDLDSQIQRIDFSNAEVPLYQQRTPSPSNPHDQRLKLGQLEDLYIALRYYSYEEYLEVPTFVNQMVLLFQQNALPLAWKEFDFTVYAQMAQKLMLKVPGQDVNIYSTVQVNSREFFDWKKLMTMFILIGAPLPSQADLDNYQSELLSKSESTEGGFISREHFIQTPAWFDDFESVAQDLPALPQGSPQGDTTVDDDDDEEGDGILRDKQRLADLKGKLFDVHQLNTKVLKVSQLIRVLSEVRALASSHENFFSYLFLN